MSIWFREIWRLGWFIVCIWNPVQPSISSQTGHLSEDPVLPNIPQATILSSSLPPTSIGFFPQNSLQIQLTSWIILLKITTTYHSLPLSATLCLSCRSLSSAPNLSVQVPLQPLLGFQPEIPNDQKPVTIWTSHASFLAHFALEFFTLTMISPGTIQYCATEY